MSDDSSNKTDVSTIHLDNISLQNRECVDSNSKFIGFDLSTQQLKAIVIDDKLKFCHQVSVDFDKELSEYKTRGGVHRSEDGSNTVTAPVNMWLKALDICLDKLKIDGLDFSTVLGLSGCAQQHGSVWWRRESGSLLANMNPDEYLHKELLGAFSLRDTPIWMDSSTSVECKLIEQRLGGPRRLAEITGSRAYERFTGPQIARVMGKRREVYLVTERITLVSNFLASVLCGTYAPFDASDASGMNLMDIRTKRWSDACLAAVIEAAGGGEAPAPAEAVETLRAKLGCVGGAMVDDNIVDSHEVVGRVAGYFVERFGFPPECLVSSFTGDNPASMAGLCVAHDELVVSLGTSDTALFWLDRPTPGINGHVLRNPLDEAKFMGLVCFKNGSKSRERIRDLRAKGDWAEFERLLESVPRANFGNLGFYYDLREIYPLASGDFRFNKLDQRVDDFAPEIEVRALLEGQFLRLLHHSRALGFERGRLRRVLVTGGASANRAILQVVADIFRAPVYTLESVVNSACLGGAYLAKFAYELEQQKLDQSFGDELGPPETRPEADLGASSEHGARLDALHPTEGDTGLGSPADCRQARRRPLVERQFDFAEMVLGAGSDLDGALDGDSREASLVLAAEPTPIGASTGDVYEALLERYVKLETEIALNNDAELASGL